MNGVHDMGGQHGHGPIAPEPDEPLFHEPWEGRALALTLAAGAWGRWNLDASRFQREQIAPADYLRMTYYEKWIAGLEALLVQSGLVTAEELASGAPAQGSARVTPRLTAAARGADGRTQRLLRARPRRAAALRRGRRGAGARTSTPPATPACRATRAGERVSSLGGTAPTSSPTPTPAARASSRSTSTRSASRPANSGAKPRRPATRSISTSGSPTLSAPEPPAVFDEPWQAEAFALAVHLNAAGAFTWTEWAAALSAEIAAAGAADDGARYYEHWLAALEGLATTRGLAGAEALADRKQAWAEAYRTTPHGKPVLLGRRGAWRTGRGPGSPLRYGRDDTVCVGVARC